MAVPVAFDEDNDTLGPPEGMSDECDALSICRTADSSGRPLIVSCWKLTKNELDEINRTGRLWLLVWGLTMRPTAVTGERPFSDSGRNENK